MCKSSTQLVKLQIVIDDVVALSEDLESTIAGGKAVYYGDGTARTGSKGNSTDRKRNQDEWYTFVQNQRHPSDHGYFWPAKLLEGIELTLCLAKIELHFVG